MNQATLPVHNMELAVNFYLTLGFTQIVDTPHYARFVCPDGDSTFSLSIESGEINPGTVIYFESDRLDELVGELVDKGIKFEQLPIDQTYLWKEAILKDPSGNKIKLYWAGENRINPPWKVEKKLKSLD